MRRFDLDIVIFCAGLPFDSQTIPSGKSLGGSETSACQLADALARQGHHVSIFCNTDKTSEANGVTYMPMGAVGNFPKGYFDFIRSVPVDVCIVQRLPHMFQFETRAKVNFLWQHDLATRTGPSQFQPFAWNIDKIFVLSKFMKDQYQALHGGTDELYHLTRNGIDTDLINQSIGRVAPLARDKFRLTYTARPERGLDILLRDVFPKILNREPRAKLYVSRYQDPTTLDFYRELEGEMQRFGDRVEFMGHLGKQDLYRNYAQSNVYIYPSMFEEVYAISALEAAACGAVFLGPWRAALPETIGGFAPLIRDDGSLGIAGDAAEKGLCPPTEKFCDGIVDQALRLMRDDDYADKWRKKGEAHARALTWDGVATDWVDLAHRVIEKKANDSKRVLRHLLFTSDVVAAGKFVESRPAEKKLGESYDNYVDRYMPFISRRLEQKPTLRDFYERLSGGDRANWQTALYANQEIRLKVLKSFLREEVAAGRVKTLLDFGCAHGGYSVALSNEFPDLKIVGVDTSKSLIRCANELKASEHCKYPANVSFYVADENADIPELRMSNVDAGSVSEEVLEKILEKFDCVVAMEVLEHLPDAEDAAIKLEKLCKPDGYMVLTVPHGHRERDEFITKGVPPVHVRAFDLHDLRDIWGDKPEYFVSSFSDCAEHQMDKTFSCWFMLTFKADHKPLGEIDYERKFTLLAPRQTLGVAIIAHNNEDIMHRCLRSVVKYADQIVIVDNGPSSDRTSEVAREYTADVRAGTSPFWCYSHAEIHRPDVIDPNICKMAGFETPRNESVEGMWTDHILWVDTDETLLEISNLPKYLRDNIYLGYAIQQHHVSIDAPGGIKKDIPVRLYRNIEQMHFLGLVHEHAELGINKGIGPNVTVINDVHIAHDGYLIESVRRGRFGRNFKLLECDRKKYPERTLGKFLYEIRDHQHIARYAMEQSGGRVNDEVRRACGVTIDTFRREFLKEEYQLAEDALNYYSQALSTLGIGFELSVDIEVKQNANTLGQKASLRFRAADAAEATKIVDNKINGMSRMISGPYYQ